MENESSRPVGIPGANASTSNVSQTQVLTFEQTDSQNPSNENASDPPAPNIVVEGTNLEEDNETQRLRIELEKIQKENQEFERQKQKKMNESQQAELRRQISEAARIRANLVAAVNNSNILRNDDANQVNGINERDMRPDPSPKTDIDKLADVLKTMQTQPKSVVLKQKPPVFDGIAENARLWLKG